jgi:ABC-2 type transport system ATP-binding protein
MPNIIEVNHLVKYYPGNDRPAVRDVSFAVRRGEVFGLLGPAGAGKTTTLLMLAGQLKPAGGTITIAGCDLSRRSNDLKRLVRLVPQKFALLPWLSIQNNLLWYGWRHGMTGRQLSARRAEALKLAGLDGGYSTDQQTIDIQQRIRLAAALLHRPEILLLDEPTSNLDMESHDNLLRIVTEINRRGLTIVYATCEGEEAARLCHRVALIDRGRIVALDTPRALLDLLRDDSPAQKNLDAVFLKLTGKPLRD